MLLSKYETIQPVASRTLGQAIVNDKISHAYLFETNNYNEADEFIMTFVKDLVCAGVEESIYDSIINQINNNEYIELKIIDPQGLQIKKEEMIDLQNEFKSKPIEGKRKIYIIKSSDKLNSSSANTILKFLEEPEEGITAILVTTSRYQLMDTILSRCQLISLINTKNKENDTTLSKIKRIVYKNKSLKTDQEFQDIINNTINFIKFYENRRKDTLLYYNREFLQFFPNREEILSSFEIIKLLYLDSIKLKINNKVDVFTDYLEDIKYISANNDNLKLMSKLNIIIKYIEKIRYNVNINL